MLYILYSVPYLLKLKNSRCFQPRYTLFGNEKKTFATISSYVVLIINEKLVRLFL